MVVAQQAEEEWSTKNIHTRLAIQAWWKSNSNNRLSSRAEEAIQAWWKSNSKNRLSSRTEQAVMWRVSQAARDVSQCSQQENRQTKEAENNGGGTASRKSIEHKEIHTRLANQAWWQLNSNKKTIIQDRASRDVNN